MRRYEVTMVNRWYVLVEAETEDEATDKAQQGDSDIIEDSFYHSLAEVEEVQEVT